VPLEDWFDQLGGLTPIAGNLHRSPLPYTEAHFRALREGGIRVIYSMEEAVPAPLASRFDWRPHFWTDDAPPSPEQMDAFLADYLALPEDVPAVVHCKAGWGRTGSAVACALVAKKGWSAGQALSYYWERVPRAREVMTWNGQAEFVRGYAASLVGRGLR
jgi:protein-tyrosine phosphatase